LDERIIATRCHARALQRLPHEKRARSGWRACESDKVETAQPLSSFWYSQFGKITRRRVEREADLPEFATHKLRSCRPRESDCQIGIATRNIQRANAPHQIDLQITMGVP